MTFYGFIIFDGLVKSRKVPFFVIPAEAGIQSIQALTKALDSGFHRSDDFLRVHHLLIIAKSFWCKGKKSNARVAIHPLPLPSPPTLGERVGGGGFWESRQLCGLKGLNFLKNSRFAEGTIVYNYHKKGLAGPIQKK